MEMNVVSSSVTGESIGDSITLGPGTIRFDPAATVVTDGFYMPMEPRYDYGVAAQWDSHGGIAAPGLYARITKLEQQVSRLAVALGFDEEEFINMLNEEG